MHNLQTLPKLANNFFANFAKSEFPAAPKSTKIPVSAQGKSISDRLKAPAAAPFFPESTVSSLRAFLHRAENDTTAEFFNRRLRRMISLIKQKYRQGEISRARAIDETMHSLYCANRKDGYCYGLLKAELRKEREAWKK